MDSFSLQTGSAQDYSGHGQVGDTFYCYVFDGHGSDAFINHIKTLDMNTFATASSPPHALEETCKDKDFYRSGATFVLARLRDTTLEVFHVGDAKAQVFLNGTMVHETEDHTFQNPKEIIRLKGQVGILPTKAPFPISDTHIDYIDSALGHFPNGESLVPSQSLGHNGITGLDPGHYTLTFDIFDKVRVVCGSDGFWDMLPPTLGKAKELAEEAVRRWNQEWIYKKQKTTYGGHIDDVSVAILDNYIAIPPSICIPYSLSCFTEKHVRTAFPLPIRKLDEVIVGNHKLFFLHLHLLQDTTLLRNIRDKPVKLYYHDDWFWHLKLRGHFQLLHQEFIDSGLSLDHLDSFIPSSSIAKITTFLQTL